MAKTKTWIWIIAGFLGVCVLVLMAVAGAGVYFVSQHIVAKRVATTDALRQFEDARSMLKDKKPLLELDRLGHPREVQRTEKLPTSLIKPTNMVVLAWNPDRGRIVRVSLPFWLLLMGKRKVDLFDSGSGGSGTNNFDVDRLNIDVRELERIGPAFVLDYVTMNGERILVWTE
jgi:hypothetical protein